MRYTMSTSVQASSSPTHELTLVKKCYQVILKYHGKVNYARVFYYIGSQRKVTQTFNYLYVNFIIRNRWNLNGRGF